MIQPCTSHFEYLSHMSDERTFARDSIIGYFNSGQPIRRTEMKPGSLFHQCTFEHANFDAEVICKCDFKDCSFESASMKSTLFSNCSFIKCSLDGVNAKDAVFKTCLFSWTTMKKSFLYNTQIQSLEGSLEFHESKVEELSITLGEHGIFCPQFKLLGEPKQIPDGYHLSRDPWTTFSGRRKCWMDVSYNRIVNDVVLKNEQKISFKLKSKVTYVGW